jgi:hypothetical protein
MRSKLIGLLLCLALATSTAAVAMACPYESTQASNGQTAAQTAQTDNQTPTAVQSDAN